LGVEGQGEKSQCPISFRAGGGGQLAAKLQRGASNTAYYIPSASTGIGITEETDEWES